jgi:flavin reductase (DIM6/NTAB) family NADH-FMN oxidoreductase RutF
MAGVCAPVTVVTTVKDNVPYGTTVSAFASLSLDPPMVSVALDRRSELLSKVLESTFFGVNVLAKSQEDIARLFASRGVDRFGSAFWTIDRNLPRLNSVASWLTCVLTKTVEVGDHVLLLGVVEDAEKTSAAPLVYAERMFGTHSALSERET